LESNWHLNVWRFGLSGTGATRAGQLQEHPTVYITNEEFPDPDELRYWYVFPDTGDTKYYPFTGSKEGFTDFPYQWGENVGPDV